MVYSNTSANEIYCVSSDFNAFLVGMVSYRPSVFTSSDSYRGFYISLKISNFFHIYAVHHLDLNHLLHAWLFFPWSSTPELPSTHDLLGKRFEFSLNELPGFLTHSI